ncbi:MAG: CBS domain-containing protein [Saprospiraceae bacterium]|nr:CBS domain-containing protein [Saprospiraceae bacterium]MBK8670696.1 CBS domain-containing protein [Saprospiraceae bacterium]MBL0098643.1 CBS domain-containing protein [Saprospiraceae bacterium]
MSTMDLLGLTVKEVMSTDLITVRQDTILKDVNSIFERENIHHIPVVGDDKKFIGIISRSDILLLMDWGTKLQLPASIRKNTFLLSSNLAKDIMETNVIKVSPDDTIKKCVQIFRENYFRALPVIDDSDYLRGIITTYDLMILAFTEPHLIASSHT